MSGGSKERPEREIGVRSGGDFPSWPHGGGKIAISDGGGPAGGGGNCFGRRLSDLSWIGYWHGKTDFGGAAEDSAPSDRPGRPGGGVFIGSVRQRGGAGWFGSAAEKCSRAVGGRDWSVSPSVDAGVVQGPRDRCDRGAKA